MNRRKLSLALGAGALAVGAGGMAYASIPDSAGVIHGCIKSNSMLKVIDSATASCASGEAALDWSQTGPQGPVGAEGPQGPAGDPASVPARTLYGEHGYDIRHTIPAGTNSGEQIGAFDETCPAGELLISASSWVQVGSNAPGAVDAGAITNRDGSGDRGQGVMVIAWNHTASDGELRTVIQCVHVT